MPKNSLSKKQKMMLSLSLAALLPLGLLTFMNPGDRLVKAGDATSYTATFDANHPLHYIGTFTNVYWGIPTAGGSYISLGDTSLGTEISATSIVVGADKWFNVGFFFG